MLDHMETNNTREMGLRLLRRLTVGSSALALGAAAVFGVIGAATIPGTSAAASTASAVIATTATSSGTAAADTTSTSSSTPVPVAAAPTTTAHAVTGASR